jgi:hypothetical protein
MSSIHGLSHGNLPIGDDQDKNSNSGASENASASDGSPEAGEHNPAPDASTPPWGSTHAELSNFLNSINQNPNFSYGSKTSPPENASEAGSSTDFILSVDGSRSTPSVQASGEQSAHLRSPQSAHSDSVQSLQARAHQSASEAGVSTNYILSIDGSDSAQSAHSTGVHGDPGTAEVLQHRLKRPRETSEGSKSPGPSTKRPRPNQP